ncbi:hypothetical protein CASFOL_004222 [Castilleja foliolosa]|uniref:Uncharacterized protein n=1 Tax=Castilleja foliolosa TaxID=1961234 RepID=A0ABD3EDL4_9LAMI
MKLLYQPNSLNLNKDSIEKLDHLKEKVTREQLESVVFECDSQEVADKFVKKITPQKTQGKRIKGKPKPKFIQQQS